MSYTVIIKQQARKKLQSLAKPDRLRITDKINRLACNPDAPELDVKKL
jgi:mRNA interferase RelE/StbE